MIMEGNNKITINIYNKIHLRSFQHNSTAFTTHPNTDINVLSFPVRLGELAGNLPHPIVEGEAHVGQIDLHPQLTSSQHPQIIITTLNQISVKSHCSTIPINHIVSSLITIAILFFLPGLGDYSKGNIPITTTILL